MELKLENFKHLINKCGIYELIINKKSYIGSSVNLRDRLREHLSDLNTNTHKNKKLLSAFNKYKIIHFGIIEFCNIDNLIEKEEYWYNIKGYYNLQNPRKNINSQCKKVYQFSTKGEFIAEFISIAEAARKNNISSSVGINIACSNKTHFANGFLWSYENIPPFRKNKAFKPIYMFNIKGEFIEKFSSSCDAARYLVELYNLENCQKNIELIGGYVIQSVNKGCLCKGFLFSRINVCPKIPKIMMKRVCYLKNRTNNEIIKEFKNIEEASLYLKRSVKMTYSLIYKKTKIDKTNILTY